MTTTRRESIVLAGYPEIAFGGFSRVDGTVAFYSRLHALINPDAVVLDIGCGRGSQAEDPCEYRRSIYNLRDHSKKVLGIDVADAGRENPFLDEFRVIEDPNHWPVEDNSIDVAVCNYVLEHIEDPDAFFSEAARVIRPGGYFCARTPNAWSYVALAARLIPNRMHARVVGKVQVRREEQDVFPTYYRANSRGKVKRLLRDHGFAPCVYRADSQPQYLAFSRAAFRFGVFVHRWLPDVLKVTLFAFGRREGGDDVASRKPAAEAAGSATAPVG